MDTMVGLWAQGFKVSSPYAYPQLAKSLRAYEAEQRSLLAYCKREIKEINRKDPSANVSITFNQGYDFLWNSNQFFSIESWIEIYCGGPYIATRRSALTFSLASGQKYDPLRLYKITLKLPKDTSAKIHPEVREILRSRLLKFYDSDPTDDCVDVLKKDEFLYFDDDAVALTGEGLHISYSGANVVRACYESITIPYRRLRKFLDQSEAERIGWKH